MYGTCPECGRMYGELNGKTFEPCEHMKNKVKEMNVTGKNPGPMIEKCPFCGSEEKECFSILNEEGLKFTYDFPYCRCNICGFKYPKYESQKNLKDGDLTPKKPMLKKKPVEPLKINSLKNFKETEVKEERKCKGMFWRGKVSSFITDDGKTIGVKKTLRLLKKMSCPGCEHCGWLMDYISDDITNDPNLDYIDDIEDGAIYTYEVDSSQGYFDPYPEIDAIRFVKVEDK